MSTSGDKDESRFKAYVTVAVGMILAITGLVRDAKPSKTPAQRYQKSSSRRGPGITTGVA